MALKSLAEDVRFSAFIDSSAISAHMHALPSLQKPQGSGFSGKGIDADEAEVMRLGGFLEEKRAVKSISLA